MNPSVFGPAFGMLMVVTAAATAGPMVLAVLGLALVAVAVGVFDRRAATAAVLLSIAGLALSDPPAVFAAVSGMSAAAYLLTRHAVGSAAVTLTVPTVAGLVGFTVAGLAATAVAVPVSWIPLLAPAIAGRRADRGGAAPAGRRPYRRHPGPTGDRQPPG